MTMRTFRLVAALAVAVIGAGMGTANASGTADAKADVVPGLAILKTRDLDFGGIVAGTGGTVTMSTAGVRTVTGGTTLGPTGDKGPAIFSVTGEPGAGYSITLPPSVTIADGPNSMLVDTFVSTPSGAGILSGAGEQTINVGAKLHVGSGQAPGAYSNSFDVTVAYN